MSNDWTYSQCSAPNRTASKNSMGLKKGAGGLFEQASDAVTGIDMPVAALLDEGVIGRWADLFARRYRMPASVDDFTARIVGAIAEKPVLATAVIESDADFALVFEYARTVIESYVGRSVNTVAASVRSSYRVVPVPSTVHCDTHATLVVQAVA